jgi:hypothetical protein
MRTVFIYCIMTIFLAGAIEAREYHVSVDGNDAGSGSEAAPFKTIGRAAEVAYPGDVITVHAGTYRELVNPPRGGESDERRIVYRAAAGERVEIKGSERIVNWQKDEGEVWKIVLPNSFFGDYNPYKDLIHGDWFDRRGRDHHTGEVFLNGKSLYEADSLHKVRNPIANTKIIDPEGSTYVWYCRSDEQTTTIWANFHKYNPNKEEVEISLRRTCFYPSKPGINYLTIQGFHISQAATQWAAPTAEQVGMVATHWNKGWIIENNVIGNSKCSGITLGKERGTGHNLMEVDPSIDGAIHYLEVIFRALDNGWSRENIGSHIVRNNEIFACEQAGICGSMGAVFSIIEHNHIHDIYTKRQFAGVEIAGIKFHAAIGTRIGNNRMNRAYWGIWCDWMAQGTWIYQNLLYDNDLDLYFEVDHGPYLVENNICASHTNISDASQSGAYVHNLFAGCIRSYPDHGRYTPYHQPHSTKLAGLSTIFSGDNRFYNNLFLPVNPSEAAPYGTAVYNKAGYASFIDGNVYCNGAQAYAKEEHKLVLPDFDPEFRIEDKGNEVYISFTIQGLANLPTSIVTTERLGKAKVSKQTFEQSDGSPFVINYDYWGRQRGERPVPGPFEQIKDGEVRLKVWSNL